METKLCPFCAEEIAATAIKCKHCKSMLIEDPKVNNQQIEPVKEVVSQDNYSDEEVETEDGIPNYIARPIQAVIGYLLCYFGGWHWISELSPKSLSEIGYSSSFMLKEWGGQLLGSWDSLLMGDQPSFLLGDHSILISFNDTYCGFICNDAFFDSNVIQWMMLFPGIYFIVNALFNFIFDFKGRI